MLLGILAVCRRCRSYFLTCNLAQDKLCRSKSKTAQSTRINLLLPCILTHYCIYNLSRRCRSYFLTDNLAQDKII